MTIRQQQPALFLSMPHRCSYFPQRTASMLFVDPQYPPGNRMYDHLAQHGFRRSGDFIYRPHCHSCNDCISVRVPVQKFAPNRSQRRTQRKNQDITVIAKEARFEQEHFDLYLRYQAARHPGSGMDDPDPEKYIEFLTSRYTETIFYEMRLQQKLLGVAIADRLEDGLSAVYTFFDPDAERRGLGVFAILWEIEQAKLMNLPYAYLGYWIKDCPKMAYKSNYRPLEIYRDQHWALHKK